MIDLFMVVELDAGMFHPASEPDVSGSSYPTAIIPGIIRQMPATVKEKGKRRKERADRQSRLLASTAGHLADSFLAEGVIHVDRSVNW